MIQIVIEFRLEKWTRKHSCVSVFEKDRKSMTPRVGRSFEAHVKKLVFDQKIVFSQKCKAAAVAVLSRLCGQLRGFLRGGLRRCARGRVRPKDHVPGPIESHGPPRSSVGAGLSWI